MNIINMINFKNFYSQTQKEAIDICRNNQKQIPSLKLDDFFELFIIAGLPEIEKLAEIMFLNKPELKINIAKLINFFKNQPINFINKFYSILTPKDIINSAAAPIIFIYGTSKSLARCMWGIEVYKKNPAPIIISDHEKSKEFKKILIDGGVSEKDIFEENKGRNFIENAYYSINIALKNKLLLNEIILITASLVALRALLITQIFLSPETKVFSSPVEYDLTNSNDPTSPQDWYKNDLGIQVFLSEIVKLYIMKKEKLLKD